MPVLTSVRRVVGRDELWTVEGIVTYPDAGEWFLLAILELEGERIGATTEYFRGTLEAPPGEQPTSSGSTVAPRPAPADCGRPPRAALGTHRRLREGDGDPRLRYAPPLSGPGLDDGLAAIRERIRTTGPTWPSIPTIPAIRRSTSRSRGHRRGLGGHADVQSDTGPRRGSDRRHRGRQRGYPDTGRWFISGLVDVGDGRVLRETHYWTRPFEAAAWRAPFVERYDPLVSRG
jgi:hypothetical protein